MPPKETVNTWAANNSKEGQSSVSAVIKDIEHITATSGNWTGTGSNTPCREVLVMAHPDNTGRCWVKPRATASASNGWPLDKGETIKFSLANLNELNALIVVDTEKLIVAYTE